MDGGRRLLRSLGAFATPLAPTPYALGGPNHVFSLPHETMRFPRPRMRRRRLRSGATRLLASRFVGTGLVFALLLAVGGYGAVRGGSYGAFVAAQGSIPDMVGRFAGFGIKAVTITGTHALAEGEILTLAGIGPQRSLAFLDVADIRSRLKAIPLIKDASVTKLYPDRLLLEIEERVPYALWQKEGVVSIVAADGTPIDDMKDARYQGLPMVVGEGANARLPEYVGILERSGELRNRVRAGLFIAGRRWTLKMDSGIEIALPERDPASAVARLAALEHDGHILEKDVTQLDLRVPGRVSARLTAEAAAARADAVAKKSKKKGATT